MATGRSKGFVVRFRHPTGFGLHREHEQCHAGHGQHGPPDGTEAQPFAVMEDAQRQDQDRHRR